VSDPAAFRPALHRYALVVAVATAALLFVGALVTSTGSALAVPDWPLSFGKLFPSMTGGVLFEHGHRMAAATVGLLTIVLAIWLWRAEARRWVRWLGAAALAAVVLQGVLGGITVLLKLPVAVAVAHAGLAEIFFCLTVVIALVTSTSWLDAPVAVPDGGRPSLRTLSLVTVVVAYLQVLAGALVRHTGAALAIPDFPLAFGSLWPAGASGPVVYQLVHRVGALVVAASAIWTVAVTRRRHGAVRSLRRPALMLALLLAWQIYLGAAIIWTRRAVVPTTTHVLSGALVLATSLVLALRARRLLSPRAAPARAAAAAASTAG
jgi:cytochrome c oxidase assembly protein subunit 15